MVPESSRIERLEDELSALKVASAHGFGEVRQDIAHLQKLLEATINRPPAPPPTWVMLLASGTFLLGLASLLLATAQLLR